MKEYLVRGFYIFEDAETGETRTGDTFFKTVTAESIEDTVNQFKAKSSGKPHIIETKVTKVWAAVWRSSDNQ